MNDRELADEIERYLAKAPRSTMVLGYDPPVWQQIIAALRRSQPEREPATEAVREILKELAAIAEACVDLHQNRNRPDSDAVMAWDHAKLTLGTLRKARALKGKGASQGAKRMVMVPREPTKIMLEAGDMALHDPDDLADAYRAMLAVAALNPRAAWPFPDPKPVDAAEKDAK